MEGNDNQYEAHIGQTLDVELLSYENEPSQVYARVDQIKGVFLFKIMEERIKCDGNALPGSSTSPTGAYEVIDKFSITIEQPRKPHYGSSPAKDKKIVAAEKYLNFMCKDFFAGEGSQNYEGVTIYLSDFYEYEEGTDAWFVMKNGDAFVKPMEFTEKDGSYEAIGGKGFMLTQVKQINELNYGRNMFEKETQDSIRQYTCDEANGLSRLNLH